MPLSNANHTFLPFIECALMALAAKLCGRLSFAKRRPFQSSQMLMPKMALAPEESSTEPGRALRNIMTVCGTGSMAAPTARPIMWPSPVGPWQGA